MDSRKQNKKVSIRCHNRRPISKYIYDCSGPAEKTVGFGSLMVSVSRPHPMPHVVLITLGHLFK